MTLVEQVIHWQGPWNEHLEQITFVNGIVKNKVYLYIEDEHTCLLLETDLRGKKSIIDLYVRIFFLPGFYLITGDVLRFRNTFFLINYNI